MIEVTAPFVLQSMAAGIAVTFSYLNGVVLKDKIFVYDLANQRIGWADYDCEFSKGTVSFMRII